MQIRIKFRKDSHGEADFRLKIDAPYRVKIRIPKLGFYSVHQLRNVLKPGNELEIYNWCVETLTILVENREETFLCFSSSNEYNGTDLRIDVPMEEIRDIFLKAVEEAVEQGILN